MIALGRKLFANTPIQRLPLTSTILRAIFKFGYGDQDVSVQFRGLQMTAPADDITLVPGLVGGFYERIELDIFTELARQAARIVDVGGNIGMFAAVAASASPADATVITFEPVPDNLTYLRRNIEANHLSGKVEVVEQAVSDAPGTASIYLAESIGTHSLSSTNAHSDRELSVQVTTVDEWIGQRPVDLMKTDVEGFDAHVLRGADTVLRAHHPALLAEFTPEAMCNAGSNPAEYLRNIFDIYETVFLVDEPRDVLRRIASEEVPRLSDLNGNYNIIAVSRPEHLRVVEDWLAKRGSADD